MARAIAGLESPLRISSWSSRFKVGIHGQCSIQQARNVMQFRSNGNRIRGFCVKRINATASSSVVPTEIETPSEGTVSTPSSPSYTPSLEDRIETIIFNCRFLTMMGVVGSLAGSLLCFLKGGVYVVESFKEWFPSFLRYPASGKVILLLVEALDVYLMGTVMLIFGMGLYGLFISNIEVPEENSAGKVPGTVSGSNLFGLFRMQERPSWLKTQSLEELKSKLGQVIVMVLLVGMFDKSKKVLINTSLDFVCFAASILLSSGSLYLLSKLHSVH